MREEFEKAWEIEDDFLKEDRGRLNFVVVEIEKEVNRYHKID